MIYNNEEYLKARLSAFKFITFKRRTIKETENNKLKNLEENLKQKIDSLNLNYCFTDMNASKNIVKFFNKVENVAEMNNLKTITLPLLEGILNEK